MDTKIKFNSITQKEDKNGDDFFIIKFEAITDDWEEANKVKSFLEEKLANLMNGQTTLKNG